MRDRLKDNLDNSNKYYCCFKDNNYKYLILLILFNFVIFQTPYFLLMLIFLPNHTL